MTNAQFQEHMARLVGSLELTNKQEKNLELIQQEYWRVYHTKAAWFWKMCVDQAISERGRRFFPTVGEMEAIADEIREEIRTNPEVDKWHAAELAANKLTLVARKGK